jgi:hypothetical protein
MTRASGTTRRGGCRDGRRHACGAVETAEPPAEGIPAEVGTGSVEEMRRDKRAESTSGRT